MTRSFVFSSGGPGKGRAWPALLAMALGIATQACGESGGTSTAELNGTPDAMTMGMDDSVSAGSFSCGALDCSLDTVDSGSIRRLCCDFAGPADNAAHFNSEAGTWAVLDGSYDAKGPSTQVTCPGGVTGGSGMSASVLSDLSMPDVQVHAKMTSIMGPDKVLVLRSRPGGNRIELNFVANYSHMGEARGGVLNISELVDCVNVIRKGVNANGSNIQIPHAMGQAIIVDVWLIGTHLSVLVDAKIVFDDMLPVSPAAGSVGFAVSHDAETQFDDLVVQIL